MLVDAWADAGGAINASAITGAAAMVPAIAAFFTTLARNSLRVRRGLQLVFCASLLTFSRLMDTKIWAKLPDKVTPKGSHNQLRRMNVQESAIALILLQCGSTR